MSDPRTPKSPRKGKYVNIRIAFLNDTVHVFQVPVKGVGLLLWEAVVNHLQLLEADYFDLEYTNHNGDDCWLDKDKVVLKQIGSPDIPLRFCVKFYTPDPGLLEDELTRYLFALQIRKDLLRGELRCSENTAALLASYIVQGEIGDFDIDECQDPTYLAVFKFVPEHLQTHEFMAKVMDYHRQHVGESPSEADLNLLDTARKVELYGIKMQSAKDHEGVSLNLAVAHLGVLVFQHYTKINTFSWAKVRKLSFKRKKFLIKLHADTYDRRLEGVTQTPTKPGRGYYKDMVEFFFDTRDRCKLFWKRCIEHHAFFRCQVVAKVARNKTRVVSRGSSFRYCGRTQKQLVEFVRENIGKRPQFERATSGRISSRSTSATPKFSSKPSMHSSSADLHTSSGSRSSGSHILDSNHTPGSGVSRDHSGTPHSAMRVESVDVHSDSSMSGSRSLNSPRLEHGLSLDQDVIEAVNARTGGAMSDDDEIDEDNSKADTYNPSRDGISHVASETKGAHSLLSPEMNSPVRYVGIYSDVGSPFYHRDQEFVSPDVDNATPGSRTKVLSLLEDGKLDMINRLPPSDGSGESKADSVNVSVHSGGNLPDSDLSNQMARPNLDLTFTDLPSSSQAASSVNLNHPKTNPSPPLLSHQSKSLFLPEASPSPTAKPACTTTPHVSTTSTLATTTSTTTTTLSASQNANDFMREKSPVVLKPESDDHVSSGNLSMQMNHRHESKKVSSIDPAQQRQARGKDKEASPPFTSPSLPLSAQYKDSDVKRSLDASPSSCVTDIAQSRQDHQVRLTSRVPSVDSNRVSSILDVMEKSSSSAPCEPVLLDSASCIDEKVGAESDSALDKDIADGRSQSKEAQPDKADLKQKYPNGGVIGAGLPVKDQLEAGQGMSRKLSAGTDLIEDIPYILHRRLDGQKEETALYKVSEADKMRRQRSVSPGAKGIMSTSFEQKQKLATDQQIVEAASGSDRSCATPDLTIDTKTVVPASSERSSSRSSIKGRPSSEKSPTLNRRFEFVNVHKLPSRTSYSSVDDTTSPSGDQEILKQLEHGSVSKLSAHKSGETLSQINTALVEAQDKLEAVSAGDGDTVVVSSDADQVGAERPFTEDETSNTLQAEQSDTTCVDLNQPDISESTQQIITSETLDAVDEMVETEALKKELSTDESHKDVASDIPDVVPMPVLSSNISNEAEDASKTQDPTPCKQYFEISKPQPCHGYDKSESVLTPAVESGKDVPKSLPLKSSLTKPCDLAVNTFGKPSPPTIPSSGEGKDAQATDSVVKDSSGSVMITDGPPPQQRAPFLSAMGRTSTSSTSSSSENNQFLIDLPSPAAALFYSDSDSPPTSQAGGEPPKTTLTFSTFRPDPADEASRAEEPSKTKNCRWSLHSVEEDEESTDFQVIMAEGVVEKSALKKRAFDESDKPKEPKRVSWHEDSDIQHSYHSDLSMTAQRSPVDDCDDAHLFGDLPTPVDSGNILETLENLRKQNSESDMTNSGSSDSSFSDGDMAKSNPKQVYFHYAATKGLSPSTIDSGVGGLSEGSRSHGHESSPLESLERLESMEGSGSSFGGGRFKVREDILKSHLDNSPLEHLEKLCGLRMDNFDDEGEADDEDDEPNFPPPPPMLDIPEEMFMSYESDLPLPDFSFPSSDNTCNLDRAASTTGLPAAMAYSSDSDTEMKSSARGPKPGQKSSDPLSSLDFGDLVANRSCTTSESESDFDADEANIQMRRMSASNIGVREGAAIAGTDLQSRSLSEARRKSLGNKPMVHGMKKIQEKPQVLPKPILQRHLAQGSQEGSQPSRPTYVVHGSQEANQSSRPTYVVPGSQEANQSSHSTHVVQKSQPLPIRSGSAATPPALYPKPQPPPVHPRPGPLRQPQMGKGKHFERARHKSSSSSSSSSSEPMQHHHPPHS